MPLLLLGLVHTLLLPTLPHAAAAVAAPPPAATAAAAARTRPDGRLLGLLLLGCYLLYIGPFFYLSNLPASSAFYLQIQQRFWPQANLLCCAWFGVGVGVVVRALVPNPAWRAAAMPAATVLLLTMHARAHWAESDQSHNDIFRQVRARDTPASKQAGM